MSKNDTARAVIRKYLDTPNPGYALLVDAPWGAGKTFFVRQTIQDWEDALNAVGHNAKHKKHHLWVSLFGIGTQHEFEIALLKALKIDWARKAKDFVSSSQAFGFSLNFNSFALTDSLLRSLPDILVFDDLERCEIPIKKLYGLLNQFVEGNQKRVILIENKEHHKKEEDKAQSKEDGNNGQSDEEQQVHQADSRDLWREKLIGRTLRIEADVGTALPAFLHELPGKSENAFDMLIKMQGDIAQIFRQTEYENLRLLKRALVEAHELLRLLPEGFWQYRDKILELIRSYLSLAIAFHHGELSKVELQQRAGIGHYKPEAKTVLRILSNRHPDVEILGYENPILPISVSTQLIGEGHMSAEGIIAALVATDHFQEPDETPLWRRVWDWRELPPNEAEELVKKIRHSVSSLEIQQPGELLHTYNGFYHMAKRQVIDDNVDSINALFISVIHRLKDDGKLQPPNYKQGRDYVYGYETRLGGISYGGQLFDLEDEMRPVIGAMKAAQDEAFQSNLSTLSASIVSDLTSSPAEFSKKHVGDDTGWHYPEYSIFAEIYYIDFATRFLDIFETDREVAEQIADNLLSRVRGYRSTLVTDILWLALVAQYMVELSKQTSIMFTAQARHFTRTALGYDSENKRFIHL